MHIRPSRALLPLVLTVCGCAAPGPRVVEASVVNGLSGTASATPGAITGMRPGELIVAYPDGRGGSITGHSGGPATVEFVRHVPPPTARTGAGAPAASAPVVLSRTAHLTVAKRVALRGGPQAAVVEVDIEMERRLGHKRVPISYLLELRSDGNAPASEALLVDLLPDEFTISDVALYDTAGHAAWRYIPPIFPVFWLLIPVATPEPQSRTEFHSVQWDVQRAGGHDALVIEIKTREQPLEPGEFAIFQVSGTLPLPPEDGMGPRGVQWR